MTCPKCSTHIDSVILSKWGDGIQRTSTIYPFICATCASLLFFESDSETLWSPEQLQQETGVDVMGIIRSNAALWRAIDDSQEKVRKAHRASSN
jgi:hypothetical protein